jgi:uncharacterized protein YkwD/uncharacterized membrane protein required for colicin V production
MRPMFSLADFLFLLGLLFFLVRGWKRGFLYLLFSFITLIVSFVIAIKYTDTVSQIFSQWSPLPSLWNVFIAFFLIAFGVEAILSTIFRYLLLRTIRFHYTKANKIAGALMSAFTGVIFLSAFFFFLLLVPVQNNVKENIQSSTIIPVVLSLLDTYGGPLPKVLQDSAARFTRFITVAPKSTEKVDLTLFIDPKKLIIDPQSEARMVELVNQERAKVGVAPLTVSVAMRDVARAYSRKMLIGKYFAHVDHEGKDAADRLNEGNVRFTLAGENLAYALTVDIAHHGLMNSEGHKRNILDPQFKRIGIGVVDAGLWGKMFTQVFAD